MESSKISSHDGLEIHLHSWTTAAAKADILFLHGFFEHSGRYNKEAQQLNNQGYNVYAYDQRSHGLTPGKYRSYISEFSDFVEDYRQVIRTLQLGTERPFFLMSHSMGGLVSVSFLLGTPNLTAHFKGAIFSAPLLIPDSNTAPLLQKISGIVGTLVPRLKTIQIDPNHISRDPKEIDLYINDALNYTDKMYAKSGYQLLKQMKTIKPKLAELAVPFIILHGTEDRLAEYAGSELLYKQAASSDKTFVPLADYKHEILKELDNHLVWSKIISWMDLRL